MQRSTWEPATSLFRRPTLMSRSAESIYPFNASTTRSRSTMLMAMTAASLRFLAICGTNTLDANIIYSASQNTITVYDGDGAECTYTADGFGNWVPCVGVHATLAPTNPSDCNYAWTMPNGTVYVFETDNALGACSIQHAVIGHLIQIIGRNANNNVTLTYSYVPNGKGAENVTEIDVTHSDGQSVVLQFGFVPNTSINELATMTRTGDQAEWQHRYDTQGNLLEVDKPGSN